MKNILITLLLLMLIPSLVLAMSGKPSIEQEYLFEYSHINFAWGFQLSGMYIDKNGNLFKYNHSHSPWNPADDKSLTASDLQEKYAHKNELAGTVEKSVLKKMHKLINGASKGELSQSKNKCFDFGSGIYTAYLFDTKTEKYEPVTLYQIGDRPKKNVSGEAKVLYEWLFEVFGNKPTNCTP